jgi:hypothetical protein
MVTTKTNNSITILLTRGKVALVDDQDATLVNRYRWTAIRSGNTWYAKTHIGSKTVYMHRMVLFGEAESVDVRKADHINGDGLDNRRSNLRAVTHSENMRNTVGRRAVRGSEYKGVSVRKNAKKPFRACIHINGKQRHIGYFVSESMAAWAYDMIAAKLFGPYARPNFGRFGIIGRGVVSSTARFRIKPTAILFGWRYRLIRMCRVHT